MGSRVAEQAVEMTTNPWTDGVLPAKLIELVLVGLNASRTNLNPEGTRRHIRAAIAAGATRQEILFVLKCASVMSIPSGSFNAPLLLQEANVGSLKDFVAQAQETYGKAGKATPGVEKTKALGHWNEDWDPLLFLDPGWTDQYMAMCAELYAESVLPPKELELLLVAFDAAYPHIWPRHATSYQERVQGRCHGGRNYGSSEARSARSSGLQLGYHNPCGRTGARRREQARDGMSK